MADKAKRLKVLFCASEATPFAKTGGLGEVAGALPLALGADQNCDVALMMPRYRGIIPRQKSLGKNATVYFVEHEGYFNRAALYGNERGDYPDNLERFSYFCERALTLSKEIGFKPDIVHVHDWQTALIPVLLKMKYTADPFFERAKTLLTIHNLSYQGVFSHQAFKGLGLPEKLFTEKGFEFYGHANLLKAGIIYADRISTVSPMYAEEIQTEEFGHGLEGVLRSRKDDLTGILNGIGQEWDPAADVFIEKKYSSVNLTGKVACKARLQGIYGFRADPEVPLFGMVTRLAEQKGIELFLKIADRLLSRNVQFVLLGEGDYVLKAALKRLATKYRDKAAVNFGFEAQEAHRIYAGCDFFLMPSLFEPCGLGQLISLKYGTLPIARKTGGLADTVVGLESGSKNANGFLFEGVHPGDFYAAIELALERYLKKDTLPGLQKRAMALDFSWKNQAHLYRNFYNQIIMGNK